VPDLVSVALSLLVIAARPVPVFGGTFAAGPERLISVRRGDGGGFEE
jgi:hypothetical protein